MRLLTCLSTRLGPRTITIRGLSSHDGSAILEWFADRGCEVIARDDEPSLSVPQIVKRMKRKPRKVSPKADNLVILKRASK